MAKCLYLRRFKRKVRVPKQGINEDDEANLEENLSIVTDSEEFDTEHFNPKTSTRSYPSIDVVKHSFQDNFDLWNHKKVSAEAIDRLNNHPEAWSYIGNSTNRTNRSKMGEMESFDPNAHELVLQSLKSVNDGNRPEYKCIIRMKMDSTDGDVMVALSSGDMIHVDHLFRRVSNLTEGVSEGCKLVSRNLVRSSGNLSTLPTIDFEPMPVKAKHDTKNVPSFLNTLAIAVDNIIYKGNKGYCALQLAIQSQIKNKFGDMSDIPLLF